MRRSAAYLWFMIVAHSAQAQVSDTPMLLTRAEQTNFAETSRYEDVMAFVDAVAETSTQIHTTSFGYSFEGRALPLVVVGDIPDATAEAVRGSGKTRVFIQANIHAGEVCGKEAMQILLRDLAGGAHPDWLDSLVLLIAPVYNADGNERINLINRPNQHGPVAGMGQRPNAQGYDLNRDHMKLDSPEARSLVHLFNEYDPHVIIDLHTTNGTRHGYHITYSPPLHPNTDPRINAYLREAWLPAAGKYLADATGWTSFYYGNAADSETDMRGWYTFDHRPRFNNNYTGLRNRFAILSEAYAYATFEERVFATLRFVEGAVQFAFENAHHIQEIVKAVDATSVSGTTLALRAAPQAKGPIEILMGAVNEVRNPYSGEVMFERKDTLISETMIDYGSFSPAETETVPLTYYIPESEQGVLHKLADHGIVVERLAQETTVDGEEFRIDSTTVAMRAFQQHQERTLFGSYHRTKLTMPAGSFAAHTNQPLGRLLFYLLEPRSDDGLVNWNVLDGSVEQSSVYPIRRR